MGIGHKRRNLTWDFTVCAKYRDLGGAGADDGKVLLVQGAHLSFVCTVGLSYATTSLFRGA